MPPGDDMSMETMGRTGPLVLATTFIGDGFSDRRTWTRVPPAPSPFRGGCRPQEPPLYSGGLRKQGLPLSLGAAAPKTARFILGVSAHQNPGRVTAVQGIGQKTVVWWPLHSQILALAEGDRENRVLVGGIRHGLYGISRKPKQRSCPQEWLNIGRNLNQQSQPF